MEFLLVSRVRKVTVKIYCSIPLHLDLSDLMNMKGKKTKNLVQSEELFSLARWIFALAINN